MKKGIVVLSLMLCCILWCCSINVVASTEVANGQCGENINWSLTSDGILIINGNGSMYDYAVLSGDIGEVSSTYAPWRENHATEIKEVQFEGNINYIGWGAFATCINLKTIDFSQLTENARIAGWAFWKCESLSDIIIPDNIVSIGRSAFLHCPNIKNITISEATTNIEPYSIGYLFPSETSYEPEYYNDFKKIICTKLSAALTYANANGFSYEIDDKLHHYDSGVIETNSTCVNNGTKVFTCSYCGNTSRVEIPVTGHIVKENASFVTITRATCVSKGTQGKKCESCNQIIEETIEETPIDSTWHVGGTIKAENDEHYYTACKSCGADLSGGGTMDGERLPVSDWIAKPKPTTETQTNVSAKVTVKNTSIKKLKAKKKGFIITLKKISSVTGYEIKYSTKRNLKGAKIKKIKKYKQTSISLNKLNSKKKYYVTVRSYKKVKGKTYYSNWSKVKSVKTK